MKRRAIATLLLCHVQQISSFTSPCRQRRARAHALALNPEKKVDFHIAKDESNGSVARGSASRRQFLAAVATCSALFPLTSNAVDLSNILVGKGSWVDAATQSMPSSSISIPPSFTTYLTRFIIHYDEAASSWWNESVDSYSLLSPDESLKRECRDFANLACSMERGLADTLSSATSSGAKDQLLRDRYASLFATLVDKYGEQQDAIRHLGILFAMLPGEYQPLNALRTKIDDSELSKPAPQQKQQQLESQMQDYMSLLPYNYQTIYNPTTKCYEISPPLELIERQDGEMMSTIFGPLSLQPLTRQNPNLGMEYYTLLGISGGVGCALTHSIVIPLDVVK